MVILRYIFLRLAGIESGVSWSWGRDTELARPGEKQELEQAPYKLCLPAAMEPELLLMLRLVSDTDQGEALCLLASGTISL